MNRERCEKHGVTGCLACFRAAPVMPMPTIQRVESVRDRMDPGDLPADLQAEMNSNPPQSVMNGDPPNAMPPLASEYVDYVSASLRADTQKIMEEDPLVGATLKFTNAKSEHEKAKRAKEAAADALIKASDVELQARSDMNRALKALQAQVAATEVDDEIDAAKIG